MTKLTVPESPYLRTKTRSSYRREKENAMTPISRELVEVEKEKQEIQKERARTKRYRAKTQNLIMPSSCENVPSHAAEEDLKDELHDDHETRSRKKYQKVWKTTCITFNRSKWNMIRY